MDCKKPQSPLSAVDNLNQRKIFNYRHHPIIILSLFLVLIWAPASASESNYLVFEETIDTFPLTTAGKTAPLYASSQDFPGVLRVVRLLQNDFQRVTGTQPQLFLDQNPSQPFVVIIGTIGRSPLIETLIKKRKLDVQAVAGQWESTLIQVVENPFPKVKRALVIAGSDKRGTIYGMFDLTEKIGVSPWYWWADVPVKPKSTIYVRNGRHILPPPKVKYRGIFINDEAPALTGWAYAQFGGFNHKFYEHVFELLLRLKANYLWPGMWGKYFGSDPENPRLADEYGIVMGSSHCEPLLFNNDPGAGLWNSKVHGPWRYDINRDNIYKVLDQTVAARGQYENIYTIGLRGVHDTQMEGGVDIKDQIALLEKVIEDQRSILTKYINKPITAIPQVFIPYKEVQEYYDAGLRIPDDVTIMWSDDNWGNIRRLPKLTDPPRTGGYGIYYHYDYVGDPRNYKWLNTNQIARIWEQLHLAYEYGARQIWVVNVGDIKPMEFPISFFLDFAWDPEAWPAERLPEYPRLWAERQFGQTYAAEIAYLLTQYTRYNSRRKPELLSPDTYSLTNFQEAEKVVADYQALYQQAQKIGKALPTEYHDAFYQLVLHPIEACANLNELYYIIAKNHSAAQQCRAVTNQWAAQARRLFLRDQEISDYYNYQLANGKWIHMMDQTHIGYTYWQQPDCNVMPEVKEIQVPGSAAPGISVEGSMAYFPQTTDPLTLPEFDPYNATSHYCEIFNRGQEPFRFDVQPGQPWVKVSPASGEVATEERLWVTIDWEQAPKGRQVVPITIQAHKLSTTISAVINNPDIPFAELDGCFVESNHYVAIEAEHFSRNLPTGEVQWVKIPDFGRTLSGLTLFPVICAPQQPQSPRLEYDLYLFNPGLIKVKLFLSPTLNFHNSPHGLRVGVSLDDQPVQITALNLPPSANTNEWRKAVSDNICILSSDHQIAKAGRHILKIWGIDPGLVIQKIVLETGPVPTTYLGPPESRMLKVQ